MTDRDLARLDAASDRSLDLAKHTGMLNGTLSVLETNIEAHLKVYDDDLPEATKMRMNEMLDMIREAMRRHDEFFGR